jgi:hypothetical protein
VTSATGSGRHVSDLSCGRGDQSHRPADPPDSACLASAVYDGESLSRRPAAVPDRRFSAARNRAGWPVR